MGKSYRPYYPDEELLLPPSLREWLPENHLVYFVSDVVDHLDLSAIDKVYGAEKRGQPPYDPRMMTKLLVYAYCVGVFSSRRIQRRWERHSPCRPPPPRGRRCPAGGSDRAGLSSFGEIAKRLPRTCESYRAYLLGHDAGITFVSARCRS